MTRWSILMAAGVAAGWLLAAASPATCRADPPAARAMDRVSLINGHRYDGLIESEDAAWVYLIQIQSPPGRPMHLVIRTFDRRSVASVARAGEAEEADLRRRIEQFVNRARIESGRMDAVSLSPLEKEGNRYQHYAGKWFSLDSTADERTTRRIIVRVEQIFAAYRQALSPRTRPPRPPRLVVFRSMEQYGAFLSARGVKIRNRACFLEDENVVAVGSDLARLSARMEKINRQSDEILRQLDDLKKQLKARLAKIADNTPKDERVPVVVREKRRFDDDFRAKKKELDACERQAAQVFQVGAGQLFARIYHETFHAYLENYVFPHATCKTPRWLNEGLAVMFEGGILEGETLRVDAPNAAALKRLKADLSGSQPLALEKLLATGGAEFLQLHGSDAAASDRLYAYAWGVAYYLAFEKRLLSDPALADYVAPAANRLAPVPRFERLVKMPLDEFERQWRAYVRALH